MVVASEENNRWNKFVQKLNNLVLSGDVNMDDIERVFNSLIGKGLPGSKFGHLVKEIKFKIPKDYDKDKYLEEFGKKTISNSSTCFCNKELFNSDNFNRVSHDLVPGKTYTVKLIPIIQTVSAKECLEEYKRQNAVLVGAQGITILQENMPDEFLEGKYLVSFDVVKNLRNKLSVPGIYRRPNGGWNFYLINLDRKWSSFDVIVCFCE